MDVIFTVNMPRFHVVAALFTNRHTAVCFLFDQCSVLMEVIRSFAPSRGASMINALLSVTPVVVLDATQPAIVLQSISSANGSVSALGVINSRDFDLDNDVALYPVAGRYVAVNQVGVNPDPPVFAFGG
jgi:hypothetical protein